MTLGVLFVMSWFAVVAGYLVWQYATSALAGQDELIVEATPVAVHAEPVILPAPVVVSPRLVRVTAAS